MTMPRIESLHPHRNFHSREIGGGIRALVVLIICLMTATASQAAGPATAPSTRSIIDPRDLLAHGENDLFWMGHVISQRDDQGAYSGTSLMFRGRAQSWTHLPLSPSRVLSIASNGG